MQFFHFLFQFAEDAHGGGRLAKVDGADLNGGRADQDVFQDILP
jgi:hypothetical protein